MTRIIFGTYENSIIADHFTPKNGTERYIISVIIFRCPKCMTLCIDGSIVIITIIIIIIYHFFFVGVK